MRVKGVVSEDFVNYKRPSLFINTCYCDFKCCTEAGLDLGVCQNAPLSRSPTLDIPDKQIYRYYADNPITKAVVVGGMEPMLQINELAPLIAFFRKKGCDCPFIIYTGYYPSEIPRQLELLRGYNNIIVKFGRYIPNRPHVYDEVLGVELASDNQYAERIS